MKRFPLVLSSFLLALCLVASMAIAQDRVAVRVDGATLLAEPMDDYAKLFTGNGGKCAITVTGSSTGKGFQRLISGECDLAMMTRPITEAENKAASEKDLSVVHKMFGYIGLAIITNVRNPVKEMTMEQVNKVFTGKITNWAELGGPNEVIKVLTRPVPATGSGVLVQEKILNNQPYAEGHQVMSSWQSMVKVCSRSLAIGYMPTTSVYFGNMEKEGIRIIRLRKDEKSPPIPLEAGMSKETSYPVAVPFYLYWNSKTQNSCILNFVEHIAVKAQ